MTLSQYQLFAFLTVRSKRLPARYLPGEARPHLVGPL